MSLTKPARPPLGPRQIRVFQMLPTSADSDLECAFTVVDLDDLPLTYKAFSYVWGDSTVVAHINCGNGHTLPLTASAHEIVADLVLKDNFEFYWLDYLCIDQDDPAEKSKQIAMMGEIYSSSTQVIGWLGKNVDDGALALKSIHELFVLFKSCERLVIKPTLNFVCSIPTWEVGSRKWRALDHLLRSSWFERAWIVQEVVMAPLLLRGTEDIRVMLTCCDVCCSFTDFAWAVWSMFDFRNFMDFRMFPEHRGLRPRGYEFAFNVAKLREYKQRNENLDLWTAVLFFREWKTQLPEDKIYALANIVQQDDFVRTLRPEHREPADQLFTKVMTELLNQKLIPGVLCLAGTGWPRGVPDLPS